MPEPPVPANVDLRDFPFMPLDIVRLFGSEFHARSTDTEWRAGVTLWLKSWHQQPAASLPADDVSLARLAEFGRDTKSWAKARAGALHGWVLCSDGRLYHPVVAEKALDGWKRKCAQRDRTAAARAARQSQRLSQSEEPSVTDKATEPVTVSKGQGQGQGQLEENPPEPPLPGGQQQPQRSRSDGRASRCPTDWSPDEQDLGYARGRSFTDGQIADMAASFRTYFVGGPGRSKTYVNWHGGDGAWGTWVRNERGSGGQVAGTAARSNGREPASFAASIGRAVRRAQDIGKVS